MPAVAGVLGADGGGGRLRTRVRGPERTVGAALHHCGGMEVALHGKATRAKRACRATRGCAGRDALPTRRGRARSTRTTTPSGCTRRGWSGAPCGRPHCSSSSEYDRTSAAPDAPRRRPISGRRNSGSSNRDCTMIAQVRIHGKPDAEHARAVAAELASVCLACSIPARARQRRRRAWERGKRGIFGLASTLSKPYCVA